MPLKKRGRSFIFPFLSITGWNVDVMVRYRAATLNHEMMALVDVFNFLSCFKHNFAPVFYFFSVESGPLFH